MANGMHELSLSQKTRFLLDAAIQTLQALMCFVGQFRLVTFLRIPIRYTPQYKVPEGFPEKWSVLKDGDFISEKTIGYELRGLVPVNSHYWGSYEEKCHEYSVWESCFDV